MSFVDFFKRWLKNDKERQEFKKAWMFEFGEDLGSNNSCTTYHEKVAFELFELTKRVEELEKKNMN